MERAHLEFVPVLSRDMLPFRRSGDFSEAVFYSNGKKADRARQLGMRTEMFPWLVPVMDRGEKGCHQEFRPETAIGPFEVAGIPYPLLTVLAKGKPARKALWENGMHEGIGVVSDVVIGFVKNGRSFAVTAHKLASEEDREQLARTLYQADLAGDVEVVTMAAMYRFDKADPQTPGELYMVQLDHGTVGIDDMGTLINKISINSKTSGSMDTPFLLNHLTRHGDRLKVTVSKYDENAVTAYVDEHMGCLMVPTSDGNFIKKRIPVSGGGQLPSEKQASYDIPADNTYQAENIALGFIT